MLELNAKRSRCVRRGKNTRYLPMFYEKRPINCAKKLMFSWFRSKTNFHFISMLKENVGNFQYLHETFHQKTATAHAALKPIRIFRKMTSQSWKTGQRSRHISISSKIYGEIMKLYWSWRRLRKRYSTKYSTITSKNFILQFLKDYWPLWKTLVTPQTINLFWNFSTFTTFFYTSSSKIKLTFVTP